MRHITAISAFASVLCSLLAINLPLRADEIVLTNGRQLEGSIESETDDKVTVRVRGGAMVLERSQIRSLVRNGGGALDEYNRRSAALGSNATAQDWLDVATFAQVNGFNREAQQAQQRALELDPNNAQARLALGYKQYNGAWLTQNEYIRAAGLVRYNNAWVSPDEAQRLQQMEARTRGEEARAAAPESKAASEAALPVSYDGETSGDVNIGAVPAPPAPPPAVLDDRYDRRIKRGYTRQSHGYYRQTHDLDPTLPSLIPYGYAGYGQDVSGRSGSYVIYHPYLLRNYEY